MLSRFECGIFLPVQEVNALFRRFDTKGEGSADAEGGDGAAVSLAEAVGRMHPEVHPEVAAGRLDPQEVKDDFCEFFTGLAGGHGRGESAGAATVKVSLEGFRDYYRDVGVCEPYDTVFVPMVEALWGVQEPQPEQRGRSELTQQLVPKLKQHSRGAETAAEVFRKTLRYYSLDNGGGTKHGGVVSASGVERSLNSFGLYPNREEVEEIFAAVGSPRGEAAEVDKVLGYLCPPELPMAPMF
ncbi:unnamed protein product [Scytosiphon promiscuus]